MPSVLQRDLDVFRAVHDVTVGQHQPVGCEEEARARAAAVPVRAAAPAARSRCMRLDVDDRGSDLFRRTDHSARIGVHQLVVAFRGS